MDKKELRERAAEERARKAEAEQKEAEDELYKYLPPAGRFTCKSLCATSAVSREELLQAEVQRARDELNELRAAKTKREEELLQKCQELQEEAELLKTEFRKIFEEKKTCKSRLAQLLADNGHPDAEERAAWLRWATFPDAPSAGCHLASAASARAITTLTKAGGFE